jgi:hypothetical protein
MDFPRRNLRKSSQIPAKPTSIKYEGKFMAEVRVELWSREKFTVANPVCDSCSKPLTDFPAIVVHQPFDYILTRFKGEKLLGGYIMKGGMVMCSKCFLANLKEYLEKGDKIIIDLTIK